MIVFPNCKINLGLHILQKRADGFHNLETVFYPIALCDGLEIIQNPSPGVPVIELSLSGNTIDGNADDNICVKAYYLLRKDFPQLPPVKMHLHKVIPSGAGLGGGSSDGAFVLTLLNRKFSLGIPEEQLIHYASQLGSDCPFFIINRPCYATGRGEKLEALPLDLSGYSIVLVHPGIHINTAAAFSKIRPDANRTTLKEIITLPIEEWRSVLTNDFEASVFTQHPEIAAVKEQLYQQGAVYASMSGSGSSVYGLFKKDKMPTLNVPSHYFLREI